jgi:lysophospholipase L1-like esterase
MALRRWSARLLLFTGLLVLLLGLAELALWATGIVDDPRAFQFRRVTRAVAEDPEGRYETHPARFYALAPQHRHAPGHLGRDATGDWPFRGRPPEPAPPAMLRVAIVGDSCVYGASLDPAAMLGTRVQAGLTAHGLTADRVQVLSIGVPGYSTAQLGLLLQETLETLRPDAVVLYPAAWNDQAPALRRPDKDLLREFTDPTPLQWLRMHTRVAAALLHVADRVPLKEIMDGWKAGAPPRGYRVPTQDVGRNVDAMLARCAAAGVRCIVLAAPHPEQTLQDHPRTAQDAAAVLASAQAAGVPAIDGQALLAESRLPLARCFLDYVHPSPEGVELLAQPIAEALLKVLLVPRPEDSGAVQPGNAAPPTPAMIALATPADGGLSIVRSEPGTASVLGDEALRVTLAGWTEADPLPVVIVGGAPLIGVRAVAPDTVEGTLMANAVGLHDIVVQTARGCAIRPGALLRHDPAVELAHSADGAPATLRITGRPGDRYSLRVASELRASPVWSLRGADWMEAGRTKVLPQVLVGDAHGIATLALPPDLPTGRVYVQALLTPRGEPEGNSLAARWTAPVPLELRR